MEKSQQSNQITTNKLIAELLKSEIYE